MSIQDEQRILRRLTALSVMTALIAGAAPGCGSSDSPSGNPGSGDKPEPIPDPDTTPPTVVSHIPDDGDSTVSVQAPIQVKFSEPVKLGAKPVTFIVGDRELATTATLSADATTMTISPNSPIVPPTQVKVAFEDISDLRGNRLVSNTLWTWSAPLWLGVGGTIRGAGFGPTTIAVGPGERVSVASLYSNREEPSQIVAHSIEGTSGKWEALGNPFEASGTRAQGLAVDRDGTLVMAFNRSSTQNLGRAWRWSGTRWDPMGSEFGPTVADPTFPGDAGGFRLAASSDGKLFVASNIQDANAKSRVAVRSAAPGSTVWNMLGDTVDDVSEGSGSLTSLTLDKNGIPYVAYTDGSNEARVRSWSGSSWTPVGSSLGKDVWPGFDLAFNDKGTLFALITFGKVSGDTSSRLLRFDGTTWQRVGNDVSTGTCFNYVCGASCLSPGKNGHVVGFSQPSHAPPRVFEATADGWTSLALPAGNSRGAQACSKDPSGTVVIGEIAEDGSKITVHRLNR